MPTRFNHYVRFWSLTVLYLVPWSVSLAAEELNGILQSSDYFPDTIGSHWEYHGQITEGPLQTIEHKFFTNVSTVVGTKPLRGMTVTVFHDTNPGNHGPSDSFYRRDVVGIVYHGSDPGTPLEKQLFPIRSSAFRYKLPRPFNNLIRRGSTSERTWIGTA